nr:hypothetical protein [Brachybacterium sp. Z12]
MAEVASAYEEARHDPEFYAEYTRLLRDYVGRPSPISPRIVSPTASAGPASISSARI